MKTFHPPPSLLARLHPTHYSHFGRNVGVQMSFNNGRMGYKVRPSLSKKASVKL